MDSYGRRVQGDEGPGVKCLAREVGLQPAKRAVPLARLRPDQRQRVDCLPVADEREVQMWTRRDPGETDETDHLSGFDRLARPHGRQDERVVEVRVLQTNPPACDVSTIHAPP